MVLLLHVLAHQSRFHVPIRIISNIPVCNMQIVHGLEKSSFSEVIAKKDRTVLSYSIAL